MDNNNIMNSPEIRKMLSELKGKVHIPSELILADAMGELSTEGHLKVISHIKDCEECEKILQAVKKSLDHEVDIDEQMDAISNIPVEPKLGSKLKLAATVNSKRDEIAEKIALLLLSKDSWFCIRPAITVYRNWLKTSVETDVIESEELPVAAFSSGGAEDREDFEVIINAVKFADYTCDLLVERCNSLEEVQQKLPEFAKDGIAMFDNLKLDEKARNGILEVLLENLSINGK